MSEVYTISDYLKGAVRGMTPSDEALKSICHNAGIADIEAEWSALTERQQRITQAYLYVWLATGPSSSAKWSEKDGDWSQSGGGETVSPAQVRMYLRMADAIFKEYGLPTVGLDKFGMGKYGLRNVRRTARGHLFRP